MLIRTRDNQITFLKYFTKFYQGFLQLEIEISKTLNLPIDDGSCRITMTHPAIMSADGHQRMHMKKMGKETHEFSYNNTTIV